MTTINRGNYKGKFSNAKPLFLLAVLDSIPNIVIANRINLANKYFAELYKLQFLIYGQQIITPIEKPLYHLGAEPFYELIWKNPDVARMIKSSPSAKFLRENLEYAKLDDDLWELLQVPQYRAYLKQAIIDRYLK